MSTNEPLGPDPELAALFREEAAEHVFPEAMRASVLRGVEHAVLLAPVGIGALAVAKAWTTKAVIALAAASFVVGAVAGVAGTKVISRPRSVAVPSVDAGAALNLDAGFAPAPSSSPSAPAPAETASAPPIATSMRAPTTAPSGRTDSSPSTLARESELIETGRAALARGRSADALAATEEHRRLFPRGRLTEEREELAIRALRAAGRTDEARARAKAFLRAYPASIYSATVEEAAR